MIPTGTPPLYPTILFVLTIGVVVGLILRLLRTIQISPRFRNLSIAILIGWMAVLGILTAQGFFLDFSSVPPRQALLVLPSFILLGLLIVKMRRWNIIGLIPPAFVIGIQAFRLPLEITLHELYRDGWVAQEMTWSGFNFDVVIGILALPVTWFAVVKKTLPRWTILAFHSLGLCTVTIVATTGILSVPLPFQVLHTTPANIFTSTFPYSWLPSILVPLAVFAHILGLRQYLTGRIQ
ncbi:MAG TPA: hypothetical protein DIS79_01235 [Bacteroidetes bacterium]|nr:hypothetical protein [Bacteroidota bacterium]HRK05017.1 hypothetical protein [Chlorobiota bacterium]